MQQLSRYRGGLFAGLAFCALALAGSTVAGRAVETPQNGLLHAALDPNPALATFAASATLAASVHGVVPVHETFQGNAYYRKPRLTIVFQNVPAPLKRFSELATSWPSYDQIGRDYTASAGADDGAATTFVLRPTDPGARVQSLTLRVDDATRLLQQLVWSYKSGEAMTMTPAWTTSAGFRLVSTLGIAARFKAYNVDGTLRLTNYRPNVSVPV